MSSFAATDQNNVQNWWLFTKWLLLPIDLLAELREDICINVINYALLQGILACFSVLHKTKMEINESRSQRRKKKCPNVTTVPFQNLPDSTHLWKRGLRQSNVAIWCTFHFLKHFPLVLAFCEDYISTAWHESVWSTVVVVGKTALCFAAESSNYNTSNTCWIVQWWSQTWL